MNRTAVRLGGICGIGAAASAIPAYRVGSPELPNTPDKLAAYYAKAEAFIAANGTIPLAHLFLGIVFVAVLAAVLRAAMGPEPEVYMVVIGGAVFVALTAAGLAAEVAIPAVISTFGDIVEVDSFRPFLALSVWLYHYSQIGAAVLIFATACATWRSGVFPKWTAILGIVGFAALSHTWVGLNAAYATVGWFAVMGLVLLVMPPAEQVEVPTRRRRESRTETKVTAAKSESSSKAEKPAEKKADEKPLEKAEEKAAEKAAVKPVGKTPVATTKMSTEKTPVEKPEETAPVGKTPVDEPAEKPVETKSATNIPTSPAAVPAVETPAPIPKVDTSNVVEPPPSPWTVPLDSNPASPPAKTSDEEDPK